MAETTSKATAAAMFLLGPVAFFASCSIPLSRTSTSYQVDRQPLTSVSVPAFEEAWALPNYRWTDITRVYVAPVSTQEIVESESASASLKQDAEKLARYMEASLKDALRDDRTKRFELADTPANATVSLEFSITALQPANPLASSTGYALGGLGGLFFQPLWPISGAILKNQMRGRTQVEGKFRDVATDTVFFMFCDGETGRPTLFSVRDLQRYAHSRYRLRKWAKQCVSLLRAPSKPLRDPLPVTLNPF